MTTATPTQPVRLTKRRLEILLLAANGHTNQQIARRTGVTLSTVKTQMHLILHRLGAEDRTHAVMIATVYGLIKLTDIRIPTPNPPRTYTQRGKDTVL